MLFIDFATLLRNHPEHEATLRMLSRWARQNPKAQVLVPHLLVQDLREVDPESLNNVFDLLIDENAFVQVYRVIDPAIGTFVGGAWDSPNEVPVQLRARDQRVIDKNEAKIVPVLMPKG
jgi:hypothetical protein